MSDRTAADVLGELSSAKLDDLAERVATKLDERQEAKENANPNAWLLPTLERNEAKDRTAAEALGLQGVEGWDE